MATQEERRVIFTLTGAVRFEGQWYEPGDRGGRTVCEGCAFFSPHLPQNFCEAFRREAERLHPTPCTPHFKWQPKKSVGVLWLLTKVVEFRGQKYQEAPLVNQSRGSCNGCAFIVSGSACADFHEDYRPIRDGPYCDGIIWKKIE